MDFKLLKWQILHGSLARRLLLRAFFFALAMAIFPFVQIVHDARTTEPLVVSDDDCSFGFGSSPHLFAMPSWLFKPMTSFAFSLLGSSLSVPCKESKNLTTIVLRELMSKNLLDSGAKAICVGEGSASAILALRELGFSNAVGVDRHPFFSLLRKRFVYELDFKDNYFDFVYSRALDRVSVPALFVLEAERVLRPGGYGALLVGARDLYSGSLIRSATPVSSFLKSSNVVHVRGIGSSTLVVFKKKFDSVESFDHYHLPDECPSITNNKPYLKHMEPLIDENSQELKPKISYLPKFLNVSSRNRLIYINMGAGEYLNASITNWLRPFYSIIPQAFNAYLIDHDISMLSSYVRKPGITFVYYPSLAGSKATASSSSGDWDMPLDDEEFDFVAWFKETVTTGDLVVLEMNARAVELKILFELFESGAICNVDELFLRCSDCNTSMCGDCIGLFKVLRNSGIFVHQLWGA